MNPDLKNLKADDSLRQNVDEELFGAEDIYHFGHQVLDADARLIIGWDVETVLKELIKYMKESSSISQHERIDISLAKVASSFLKQKLAPIYIEKHGISIPLRIAKLIQKMNSMGHGIELGLEPQYTDVPKFFQYTARLHNFEGNGVRLDHAEAAMAAIAESVERWESASVDDSKVVKATIRELRGATFPDRLLRYFLSPAQKGIDYRLSWVLGMNGLNNNKPCWLPAQLVFWYRDFPQETMLHPRTTSGCACDRSLEQATLKAILELVERDTLLVSWLRMISPRKLSTKSIIADERFGADLRKLISDTILCRFDLHLLLLPTDFPIYAICCVLRDPSGIGPAVSVGAKADLILEESIKGAILEAFAVYTSLRWRKHSGRLRARDNNSSFADDSELDRDGRLAFWSQPSMFGVIDWFLAGEEVESQNLRSCVFDSNLSSPLILLSNYIKQKNFHLFTYHLSDTPFRELGLHVVRAIIPELMPLYLFEKERELLLHHPRLVQLPADLGITVSEIQWNKYPHPFP